MVSNCNILVFDVVDFILNAFKSFVELLFNDHVNGREKFVLLVKLVSELLL